MPTRVPSPPAPVAAPVLGGHPIQVVARRTGLSADVIRAWEKRYDVVSPTRSASGRRLYSDADIERLQLLARATLSGHTIGQVAGLDAAALEALLDELDRAETIQAAQEPAPPRAFSACLDAIERFDVVELDAELRRAVVALSAEAFIDTLVVPLHLAVTARIRAGTLHPAHEHIALAALRRALDRIVDAATSPLAPPDLVVSTPSGQTQELGALLAAATAAAEGWRPLYLGPGLPAEAIAETAVRTGARAVTLSLGDLTSDRLVPRELRRLRSLLPPGVAILVEGASDANRGVLREIDAIVVRDPAALRAWLRAPRETRKPQR